MSEVLYARAWFVPESLQSSAYSLSCLSSYKHPTDAFPSPPSAPGLPTLDLKKEKKKIKKK